MISIFRDSPEYIKRTQTPFVPSKVTLAEIHAAVPKHLHKKSTAKSLLYVLRAVAFGYIFYKLAWKIEPLNHWLRETYGLSSGTSFVVKWSLWGLYWWWQGLAFAGWWFLGHEAGHGSLSDYVWVNHVVGFVLNTLVLSPYYAWRASHRAHHKGIMSLERDENYIPRTRSQYNLPPEPVAEISAYHDMFDEAPIYTLGRMLIMQAIGWQYYLLANAMGQAKYPPGTNHFQPSSMLFKPHERNGIIACNIGLSAMAFILYCWAKEVGLAYFVKIYFIPYLLTNHWIVMITFLHHADPTVPYYRDKEWTFVRGTLAAVDRPVLGWIGVVFLHNCSHNHISHHLFSSIPFYNQPAVTEAIKTVLKDDYNYDSTNSARALYRSFTQCLFVEDEGDIVFYKNKHGRPARVLAPGVLSGTVSTE